MLTDEKLIQRIRRQLNDELAEIHPIQTAAQVWRQRSLPSDRPGSHRPLPGRVSRFASMMAIALAVSVVAGVVVVAVVVGGGSRAPSQPGAHGHDQANSEKGLLRIVGVLRRPQTKADLPKALLPILQETGRDAFVGRPDLAGVRLATVTPAGEQVFLVPLDPPTVPSVATYLSRLPKAIRRRARQHLERPGLKGELRAEAAQGDRLEVQLLYHGHQAGVGPTSTPTAQLFARQGAYTFTSDYNANSLELILVVPDGVARVTVIAASHDTSSGFTRVTGVVHNNVATVLLPAPVENPANNMIWYGPAGNVLRRIGDTRPTTPPPASSVRAPITVRVLKAKRYCYKRLAFGGFDIPCDRGIPHGYKPAPWMSRSLALVDISFTARLPANNHHSVYEFTYARVSGPSNCTLNTGGASGTTMAPIRAGQRVTIQDDSEVCPGTFAGLITYQPNGGPGQDTLGPGRPERRIGDGSVLVGRFSYVIH